MRPCLIDRTLTKGQADVFYLARNLDSETQKMLSKMSVVITDRKSRTQFDVIFFIVWMCRKSNIITNDTLTLIQVRIKSILDRTNTEWKNTCHRIYYRNTKKWQKRILKVHPVVSTDYISKKFPYFSSFLLVRGVIIKNVGPRYKCNWKIEKQDRLIESMQPADFFSLKKKNEWRNFIMLVKHFLQYCRWEIHF